MINAGIELVFENTDELTAALMQGLSEAVTETATAIQDTAKQLAPVDTGALRESIRADTAHVQDDLAAEVAPGVPYAVFQELGTRRNAPHPFMSPAAESERQNFVKRCQDAGKRVSGGR